MKDSKTTKQYKSISSKAILAKVVSQFGLDNYNLSDGIEWIFEAVEAIGFHLKKIHTEERIEFNDYIIPKPSNFVSFAGLTTCEGEPICKNGKPIGYDICNGNIIYTLRDGKVILQYETTGVDTDGYPLIRDTFKYREAVTYFLLVRFFEDGNKHPTLDIRYALERFTFFRLRAKNEWKVTEEVVDKIVNSWDHERETSKLTEVAEVRFTDRSY